MVIISLIVIAWINLSSKETLILHNDRYVRTYETEITLIKNEQVFYFDDNPSYFVSSGTRVSLNRPLSDQKVTNQKYISDKVEILNAALSKNEATGKILDTELIDSFDEEKKMESQRNIRIMLSSLKYCHKTDDEISTMLEDISASTITGLTLKKIGSSYPGYVYFEDDGYEQILAFDNMDLMSEEFLKQADEFAKLNAGYGSNILKVADDDAVVLVAEVSNDVQLQREASLDDKKNDIYDRLEKRDLASYVELLTNRVDILRSLPKVRFTLEDKEFEAHLIESVKGKDNKLLIFIMKDMIDSNILKLRKAKTNIYTYENQGYVIPAKSVFKKNGKTYIMVLSKGYLRKNIEVRVTEVTDGKAFLSKSDNSELSEGLQVLVNP